ncbi:hypothetical protein PIB30_086302 [Stylosanthes scabra]|uniref:Uncharacterized protein n=1 Tax=Stylosanthes scabra TaxID=79078 RepID=A0ABU6ZRR0_9FABA|nr:hypothetical protein [Stylosanthes scabra]
MISLPGIKAIYNSSTISVMWIENKHKKKRRKLEEEESKEVSEAHPEVTCIMFGPSPKLGSNVMHPRPLQAWQAPHIAHQAMFGPRLPNVVHHQQIQAHLKLTMSHNVTHPRLPKFQQAHPRRGPNMVHHKLLKQIRAHNKPRLSVGMARTWPLTKLPNINKHHKTTFGPCLGMGQTWTLIGSPNMVHSPTSHA